MSLSKSKRKSKGKKSSHVPSNDGDGPIVLGDTPLTGFDFPRFKQTKEEETLIDTLRAIDENLVTFSTNGDRWALAVQRTPFGRHVPPGQLACGLKKGRAHFYTEGYYLRAGFGHNFGTNRPSTDPLIVNHDVTIVNMKENEACVVCSATKTYAIMGPGQYVARAPFRQIGSIVDMANIEGHVMEFKDPTSGSTRATMFHVEVGQVAITQTPDGVKEYGPGNYVMTRTGEKFVRHIEVREREFTMRDCTVQTRDGVKLKLSIYLVCKIENATTFHLTRYEDAIDAVEEQIKSHMANFFINKTSRDIVSQTHMSNEAESARESKKGKGKEKRHEDNNVSDVLRHAEEYSMNGLVDYAATKGIQFKLVKILEFTTDKVFKAQMDEITSKAISLRQEREMLDAQVNTDRIKAEAKANLMKLDAEKSASIAKYEAEAAAERARIDAESKAEVDRIQNQSEVERKVAKITAIADAKAAAARKMAEAEAEALRIVGEVRAGLPTGHAQSMELAHAEVQKYRALGKGAVYLPFPGGEKSAIKLNLGS